MVDVFDVVHVPSVFSLFSSVWAAAYTDCGQCVGGGTGLQPARDCAEQCQENHVVTIGDSQMCVRREPARTPPCDNQPGSGAYYNL